MISFPLCTEMFQFHRSPSRNYRFISRCCRFATAGFPIRTSPDQRLYTAPRGFSQCPTSFFGTWRQGIHHKPLVAYLLDAEISLLFACSSSAVLRGTASFSSFLRLSFHIQLVMCSGCLQPSGRLTTHVSYPLSFRRSLTSALNLVSIRMI